MNVPTEPGSELPVDREEVVAYLDGELGDDRARQRIEDLLAIDASFRSEVQKLERAWDLLDTLPRAEVDEAFTQTTVEMVAVKAEEDMQTLQQQEPAHRWRQMLLVGGLFFLAGLLGVLAVNWAWPPADEQLLEDLPVVEQVDQYQHVGDIEFLRQLHQKGMFENEPVE